MADDPIIVTDTDELRRMFAADIYVRTLGITERHAERLAVALIGIMRANCPPSEPKLLMWDYRQQPDLEQLAKAIRDLFGGHLHEVETGTDDCAIVLSTTELCAGQLAELWNEGN